MILFATHGNSTIGMGHIVRTLTLAQELRRQTDEPIRFAVPEQDGIARYQILAAGFGFWEDERPRVLVQDYAEGYEGVYQHHHSVQRITLADVATDGDTVAIYGKGPLVGPDYAIVREQFLTERGRARRLNCGLPRVLMSFGGADPAHIVEAATYSLASTPYHLTAVLGPAYQHAASYIERWGTRVTIHRPAVSVTSRMAEYMGQADLLLCSGGMTPIEAACVGTPTITIAQNEHEHARMVQWQHHWTGYYLGQWHTVRYVDIQQATVKLLADPDTLHTMSMRGSSLIDGKGAQRAAQAILSMRARATHAA